MSYFCYDVLLSFVSKLLLCFFEFGGVENEYISVKDFLFLFYILKLKFYCVMFV